MKSCDSRASAVDFVADTSMNESEDDIGLSDFSSNSDDLSESPEHQELSVKLVLVSIFVFMFFCGLV